MANGDDAEVLPGPRAPSWACSCGRSTNWASRVVCKCGKAAPQEVRRAAEKNARGLQHQPRGPTPGSKREDRLAQRLDELQRKFDKMVSGGGGDSVRPPNGGVVSNDKGTKNQKESDIRDNIKKLEALINQLEMLGDTGLGAKSQLETELVVLRGELAACKPQLTQHTNIGHSLARTTSKKNKLEEQIQEQLEIVSTAQESIDGMRANLAATEREIEALNHELVRTLPGVQAVDLELDPQLLSESPDQAMVNEMLTSEVFQKFQSLLAATHQAKMAKPTPVATSPFKVFCQSVAPPGDGEQQPTPGFDNDADLDDDMVEEIFQAAIRVDKRGFIEQFGSRLCKKPRSG